MTFLDRGGYFRSANRGKVSKFYCWRGAGQKGWFLKLQKVALEHEVWGILMNSVNPRGGATNFYLGGDRPYFEDGAFPATEP